jgi:hypothetical protein
LSLTDMFLLIDYTRDGYDQPGRQNQLLRKASGRIPKEWSHGFTRKPICEEKFEL